MEPIRAAARVESRTCPAWGHPGFTLQANGRRYASLVRFVVNLSVETHHLGRSMGFVFVCLMSYLYECYASTEIIKLALGSCIFDRALKRNLIKIEVKQDALPYGRIGLLPGR